MVVGDPSVRGRCVKGIWERSVVPLQLCYESKTIPKSKRLLKKKNLSLDSTPRPIFCFLFYRNSPKEQSHSLSMVPLLSFFCELTFQSGLPDTHTLHCPQTAWSRSPGVSLLLNPTSDSPPSSPFLASWQGGGSARPSWTASPTGLGDAPLSCFASHIAGSSCPITFTAFPSSLKPLTVACGPRPRLWTVFTHSPGGFIQLHELKHHLPADSSQAHILSSDCTPQLPTHRLPLDV